MTSNLKVSITLCYFSFFKTATFLQGSVVTLFSLRLKNFIVFCG